MKRCRCDRKRRSECAHPWYFNFCVDHASYRFNLNQRAGLPRKTALSRSDAERWRDEFRIKARKGEITRRGLPVSVVGSAGAQGRLTLRQVADRYEDHFATDPNRRPHRLVPLKKHLASICRTLVDGVSLGDKWFDELRPADLEAFRDERRRLFRVNESSRLERSARIASGEAAARSIPVSTELPHAKHGEVGTNRSLERLRALCNWGLDREYSQTTPFRKNGRPTIRMAKETHRTRRLRADEEQRLLAHASVDLQVRIIAAIDTGLRRRELLTLQWKDVLLDSNESIRAFSIRAESSKTNVARVVPVLSERLRELLVRRRKGPDGKELGLNTFVFGNEVGEEVGEF